jgi:hypothetical protein
VQELHDGNQVQFSFRSIATGERSATHVRRAGLRGRDVSLGSMQSGRMESFGIVSGETG